MKVVACVLLCLGMLLGIAGGWLNIRGHPLKNIRKLEKPVKEREREIDDLVAPGSHP